MSDIFIVEDDKALNREISLTISKWGYRVIIYRI